MAATLQQKLHDSMVTEIRDKLQTRSYADVAREYGVTMAALYKFRERHGFSTPKGNKRELATHRENYIEQKPKRSVGAAWDFSGDNLSVRD